jgi:hypothetical protein
MSGLWVDFAACLCGALSRYVSAGRGPSRPFPARSLAEEPVPLARSSPANDTTAGAVMLLDQVRHRVDLPDVCDRLGLHNAILRASISSQSAAAAIQTAMLAGTTTIRSTSLFVWWLCVRSQAGAAQSHRTIRQTQPHHPWSSAPWLRPRPQRLVLPQHVRCSSLLIDTKPGGQSFSVQELSQPVDLSRSETFAPSIRNPSTSGTFAAPVSEKGPHGWMH